MKKRIFAIILLTFMLAAALSPAVFAFPFNEYSKDKGNLEVHFSYDYDTDNDEKLVGEGLMFHRVVEYEGTKDRRAVYTQSATVTISLPSGYFDGIENSHRTDPEKYIFGCEEKGLWYNQYVTNKVEYSLSQKIEDIEIHSPERGQTMDEAIQKDIDYYYGYLEKETDDDPLVYKKEHKINKDGDGYYITIYEKGRTHWGLTSGGASDISEDYEIYDCVYESWNYIRYLTVPELPEIFIKVCYRTGVSRTVLIADKSNKEPVEQYPNGDYTSYYQEALKKYEEYSSRNTGDQILNLRSLMSISWGEPIVAEGETVEKDAGITQNAKDTPGEDEGVSVPAAIIIGVGGAGAAVAAAAAASGDGKEDKNKKSYKMYVQKDFGDAIRSGAEPVKVRARMAEADASGAERDRADLTAKIGVTGDGMTVHGVALVGRYCEATVSVPENYGGENASVTFVFTGEGGSFSNTVVFRVVGGPSLKFVDQRDGTLYHENCGINMIPGDGFTYTEKFMIVDATVAPEPSDISAQKVDDFDVTFEKTEQQYVYKMTVRNNTKRNPQHDIFDKIEEKRFEISVVVKGEKNPVKGYVTAYMYPEGLTVQSRNIGNKGDLKYVRVQAYEKEHVGDLDKKWQVSEINFTLAVIGKDKAIIDPKESEFKFEKLKGAGGKGTDASKEQAIAEKYKYEETSRWYNDKFTYDFEPQDMLWEPDNGTFFVVTLPVSCEYEMNSYRAEVPLRLRGKDPDPMEEWNKEYAKARERIEKFSLPGQKDYNLQKLEEIAAREPHISTWELRLMCKDVVRAYMKYWTEEHTKDQWTADKLDWAVWGLDWVKWIGDCAFSFVVAAYTGPLEAIISPAKDVLVNAIGEVGVNIIWGTKFDVKNLEVYDAIKNAGDNFVSGGVSDGVSWLAASGMSNPAKIKYACAIMGGYFVFAVFNNYLLSLEKGENDFYGAIVGAFKDMTVTAAKIAASMMFKKWLDSDNFKKKIGPKLEEYMQKWFGENLKNQKFNVEAEYNKSQQLYGDLALKDTLLNIDVDVSRSGIVEKYLSELCGVGAGYVYDNPEQAQHRLFWFNPAGEIMFTFAINLAAGNVDTDAVATVCDVNISKAFSNTSSKLFGWMYDLFFGGIPTADAVIDLPKDPPLPPEKN